MADRRSDDVIERSVDRFVGLSERAIRSPTMRFASLLVICCVAGVSSSEHSTRTLSCAASPLTRESAPPESSADPIRHANWYINADRTIWAGPVPDDGWPSGGKLSVGGVVVDGQKTYWVRPRGTQLVISGRRLDAAAPPVEAHTPCCYTSGFQIVGLFFPTEGCWEVKATAGEKALQFVAEVEPPAPLQQ
jgi:hypothetical protein